MNLIRLKDISDNYFLETWQLYEEAFPLEERRPMDVQIQVMKEPNYHFDVMIDDTKLIGFLLWWEFEELRYIDHFATSTELRNRGFGKLILENFIDIDIKPIILEVDLPVSDINKRRIKFYERVGFQLNDHFVELTPFFEAQTPVKVQLMSYPSLLTTYDVEQFKKYANP